MRKSQGRTRLLTGISLSAVLIAAGVTATAYGLTSHDRSYARPSGIPAGIADSQVDLMGLSPVPDRPAPDFTLTDQDGRVLSLSDFRGKAVVLEFMDPHCTDICPIVSAEFGDAYHDLGRLAGRVVFAAVNVNQYHHAVADVAAYSREHQLTSIPSWHFFTGPVPRLRAAWHDYDIAVQAPGPGADVVHSSMVYFIDPSGRERYLASPQADHTAAGTSYLPADQIAAWGGGIARVAALLAGCQGRRSAVRSGSCPGQNLSMPDMRSPEALSPPAPAAADELVDTVLAASRALVAVAARSLAAAGDEVTLPQYRALVVLAAQGPQGTAELAAALAVNPSTATRMCDRLVRKGLVRRHRQAGDRRAVRIALTPAGRALVAEVTRQRRAELARLLGALPPEEREPVIAAFRAFADAAGELPQPGAALGWAGP
jgi:DNA-binding MarR family transcriptional regulator/cytochrome oxidase Cu insertion factor (SCO1/SenC/PrrC family)